MINVFIPHRWNHNDYDIIGPLLDRTKYRVRDYSIPQTSPLDKVDKRYKLDPQIRLRIDCASVVVCSNRPANINGMAIDEIRYAVDKGKPVVAVQITDHTNAEITKLGIPVIKKDKRALEKWIDEHVPQTLLEKTMGSLL